MLKSKFQIANFHPHFTVPKFILGKLYEFEVEIRFNVDFNLIKGIVNESYDRLIDEGLKFNINQEHFKHALCHDLERSCFKVMNNEFVNSFDLLFIFNSSNDDNNELFILEDYKSMLDSGNL
jgi:hypothetical protein